MEKGFGGYKAEEVHFQIDRHSFDSKRPASQGRPLDGNEVVHPRIRAASPLARLIVLITAFLWNLRLSKYSTVKKSNWEMSLPDVQDKEKFYL